MEKRQLFLSLLSLSFLGVVPAHAGLLDWFWSTPKPASQLIPTPAPKSVSPSQRVGTLVLRCGNRVVKTAFKAFKKHPKMSFAMLCAGFVAGKALYNRYVLLPSFTAKLQPTINDKEHKIYNWSLVQLGTAAGIRTNKGKVIDQLITACPQLTMHKQPHGTIHWKDLIATIELEIKELQTMAEKAKSLASGLFVGVRRDYEALCKIAHITNESEVVEEQEQAINQRMVNEGNSMSVATRFGALLTGNINYDVAHRTYWQLYSRLLRMQALHDIVCNVAQEEGGVEMVVGQKKLPR
jgi:hypothetical protein